MGQCGQVVETRITSAIAWAWRIQMRMTLVFTRWDLFCIVACPLYRLCFCIARLYRNISFIMKTLYMGCQAQPPYGNHCPANAGECAWWDFRPNSRWVQRTWKKSADCPAINCTLFDEADFDRMSVYSDVMHDKHLGTDKVSTSPIVWQLLYIKLENVIMPHGCVCTFA